ncbi:MAG: DNA helicase II, partial [Deltaproteobacteria bacterium CG23_combo_of_CG06-09_8_20_14_all_60_8]
TPEAIPVRFVLTAEISSIYKKLGRVRKIHNLLFAPDFAAASRINARLAAIGNIESDGRPILGLDARDLLEIVLERAPGGFLVPAHIWTPWFSLFGSKSGFDRIEDCFGDLTEHIFALETGLSSDPAMNRLVSALDRFTLISNSDCHSPAKLGREANLLATGFDFVALREAMKNPAAGGFSGTLEFFPEEGKYHFDGHRKCNVCLEPHESRAISDRCPVCDRPLTIGVSHRVLELADRDQPVYPARGSAFRSLIPLPEVIGEIMGRGPATLGVMAQYAKVIQRFGSEFNLYLQAPVEEIKQFSSILGEAVLRVRAGRVSRHPGYDGEFGTITVFEEGELERLAGQKSLFASGPARKPKNNNPPAGPLPRTAAPSETMLPPAVGPNSAQEAAATSRAAHILVSAGPGTGKTYTLVARLARLLASGEARPERIAAITFTNRAAAEVRARLIKQAIPGADTVFVGTFHRFCLQWLRREAPHTTVIGDDQRQLLLKKLFPEHTRTEREQLAQAIIEHFHGLAVGPVAAAQEPDPEARRYLAELAAHGWLDIEAVIPLFVSRLRTEPDLLETVREHLEHLFVDEFQDMNQAQYQLVQLLGQGARLFAIGDQDQAIYGFRGSDLGYFSDFAGQATTTCLALTKNYRSAPEILEAANAVISHNPAPSRARLEPQMLKPGRLEWCLVPTEAAEAEYVVQRIEETMGGISHFSINSGRGGASETDRSFADVAVLYRLSRQADPIAQALERRGIPFQRVGSPPFFMGPEMRPAFHLVQAVAGQAELADFLLLLGAMDGIGPATLTIIEDGLGFDAAHFCARAAGLPLPQMASRSCRQLGDTIAACRLTALESGVVSALRQALPTLAVRQDTAEGRRFLDLAGVFGRDLAGFADHLRANQAGTVYDPRAEAVALMTLHAAKGLEFPVVFLPGLEEGLLPGARFGQTGDLEEERRLFYTGLTRARETVIMTAAAIRTMYGKSTRQVVSRFLSEIPGHLLTTVTRKKQPRKKPAKVQMTLF